MLLLYILKKKANYGNESLYSLDIKTIKISRFWFFWFFHKWYIWLFMVFNYSLFWIESAFYHVSLNYLLIHLSLYLSSICWLQLRSTCLYKLLFLVSTGLLIYLHSDYLSTINNLYKSVLFIYQGAVKAIHDLSGQTWFLSSQGPLIMGESDVCISNTEVTLLINPNIYLLQFKVTKFGFLNLSSSSLKWGH